MTIEHALPWIVAANALMTLGTAVFMLLSSGPRKTAGALETFKGNCAVEFMTLTKRLDEHAARLQAVESEMKHLPDRDMVHGLQLTLKDIQVELAGVKGEAAQAVRSSRRVEDFLMNQKPAA